MILIEVNNRNAESNSELISQTTNWAEANIQSRYVIVLNPNINGDMRITEYEPRESNNAPLGTNSQTEDTNSDNIF